MRKNKKKNFAHNRDWKSSPLNCCAQFSGDIFPSISGLVTYYSPALSQPCNTELQHYPHGPISKLCVIPQQGNRLQSSPHSVKLNFRSAPSQRRITSLVTGLHIMTCEDQIREIQKLCHSGRLLESPFREKCLQYYHLNISCQELKLHGKYK
jgi:hypothetical protein